MASFEIFLFLTSGPLVENYPFLTLFKISWSSAPSKGGFP
jgi:hypothetical protein